MPLFGEDASGTVCLSARHEVVLAEAKLAPPRMLSQTIERPCVTRALDADAAALTLVAAPAGYGKTTAVWAPSMGVRGCSWTRAAAGRVAGAACKGAATARRCALTTAQASGMSTDRRALRQAGSHRVALRLGLGSDDKRIAALALPALGALAAEPLYVLVDTAIVGHLGVDPLAALALAGAALSGAVSLCNFLAYGSTPKVGRLHAAGQTEAAGRLGFQAIVLAAALGLALAILTALSAGSVLDVLGAHGRISHLGVVYMRIAAIGLPFALIAIAGQGYLRGISRVRLPARAACRQLAECRS